MKFHANGLDHSYEVVGNGTPLVFIHAFPCNSEMWKPQVESLQSKCRVITYDIRGFGKSDVGDQQYLIDFFVDDLAALLDHLKLTKAVLCGLSMGGYVALRFQERFPDRVQGLILADTKSTADSTEAKTKRGETVKLIREKGVSGFVDGFLKSALCEKTHASNAGLVERLKQIILSAEPKSVCGALIAMAARTDTTEALAKITAPTLILVGKEDKVTPPSDAEALKKGIPHAELKTISGAGHMSNLENAGEFNSALEAFLKGRFAN